MRGAPLGLEAVSCWPRIYSALADEVLGAVGGSRGGVAVVGGLAELGRRTLALLRGQVGVGLLLGIVRTVLVQGNLLHLSALLSCRGLAGLPRSFISLRVKTTKKKDTPSFL